MWEVISVTDSAELAKFLNDNKIKPESVLPFGEEFHEFVRHRLFLVYREKKGRKKDAG